MFSSRHNELRKATALSWEDAYNIQVSPLSSVEKVTFDYQDPEEGFYIYERGREDEIGEVTTQNQWAPIVLGGSSTLFVYPRSGACGWIWMVPLG